MTITLNLSAQQQAELEQRAAAVGADVPGLILSAIEETLASRNGIANEEAPYEQWRDDFQAWIASHTSRNPRFDDRRESIYD